MACAHVQSHVQLFTQPLCGRLRGQQKKKKEKIKKTTTTIAPRTWIIYPCQFISGIIWFGFSLFLSCLLLPVSFGNFSVRAPLAEIPGNTPHSRAYSDTAACSVNQFEARPHDGHGCSEGVSHLGLYLIHFFLYNNFALERGLVNQSKVVSTCCFCFCPDLWLTDGHYWSADICINSSPANVTCIYV